MYKSPLIELCIPPKTIKFSDSYLQPLNLVIYYEQRNRKASANFRPVRRRNLRTKKRQSKSPPGTRTRRYI
nr:MAG TPA: hypothetical protein [Caudoviricetes sp.]